MDLNYSYDNIYNNMTLTGNNNNVAYDYIIDNIDSNINMDICNNNGSDTSDVSEIIMIKNKLINILNDNSITNNKNINSSNVSDEPEDEPEAEKVSEEVKEPDMLTEIFNLYDTFKKQYLEEQDNYLSSEKNLNNLINESKSNINKLDLIIKFMNELKENEEEDKILIESLKQKSKSIEENNKIVEAKKEYINNRKNILKYLDFIKKINCMNVGNVCPLCLTNYVNIYLNPCGHTCCDDCYNRLVSNNDKKCFLCRNHILNTNPLYFS